MTIIFKNYFFKDLRYITCGYNWRILKNIKQNPVFMTILNLAVPNISFHLYICLVLVGPLFNVVEFDPELHKT